jgi:hypothetical protein
MFVAYRNFEPGGAAVFAIAAVFYFASFAAAVLIRKSFPADWLLPLVRVNREQKRQNPADKFTLAAAARKCPIRGCESKKFQKRNKLSVNTGEI